MSSCGAGYTLQHCLKPQHVSGLKYQFAQLWEILWSYPTEQQNKNITNTLVHPYFVGEQYLQNTFLREAYLKILKLKLLQNFLSCRFIIITINTRIKFLLNKHKLLHMHSNEWQWENNNPCHEQIKSFHWPQIFHNSLPNVIMVISKWAADVKAKFYYFFLFHLSFSSANYKFTIAHKLYFVIRTDWQVLWDGPVVP